MTTLNKHIITSLHFTLLTIGLLTLMLFSSCKKFLDINTPKDKLENRKIYLEDNTATAAIIGIYYEMIRSNSGLFSSSATILSGLASDELGTTNSTDPFWLNNLTASTPDLNSRWSEAYKYIYEANSVLEGLEGSDHISDSIKNRLSSEALFIRSFTFLYLAEFFGDVPLILTTDYRNNSTFSRTPKTEIYQQIIEDLKLAEILASNYGKLPTEKTRPSKWAITSLLARTYLYTKDWANAEAMSNAVISSGVYTPLASLKDVFIKNSKESIWQLQPVFPGYNTWEGARLIPINSTVVPAIYITSGLINSFEAKDQRKTNWTSSNIIGSQTYYFPYKYKISSGTTVSEFYTVLRVAEQYLIRAEARAHRNNLSGSIADLNTIRIRAGLQELSPTLSTQQVFTAIEQERKIELFSEWAHRWIDLNRTEKADSLLKSFKFPNWQPTDKLWPIPQAQRDANPFLSQNTGY